MLLMTTGAAVAVFAVSIYFRLGYPTAILNAFMGGLGFLLDYVGRSRGFSPLSSVFLASFAVALLSQIGARYLKKPVTLLIVPAFFPLVPGMAIYEAVFAFISQDYTLAGKRSIDAVLLALGIALGIIAVEAVMTLWSGGVSAFKHVKERKND